MAISKWLVKEQDFWWGREEFLGVRMRGLLASGDAEHRTDAAIVCNLTSESHVLHPTVDWTSSVVVRPD
jgi:hypothetical protein